MESLSWINRIYDWKDTKAQKLLQLISLTKCSGVLNHPSSRYPHPSLHLKVHHEAKTYLRGTLHLLHAIGLFIILASGLMRGNMTVYSVLGKISEVLC